MGAKIDMTRGSISRGLYKMALPVMGTSFLQMAYNLVDMIWIGRVGSRAVAAVGSAGFYLWMSFAFILISKVGAEVRVAQSVGAKNMKRARDYARNAIQLNLVMAVFYGVLIYVGRGALIGFFNLGDQGVIQHDPGPPPYLRVGTCSGNGSCRSGNSYSDGSGNGDSFLCYLYSKGQGRGK